MARVPQEKKERIVKEVSMEKENWINDVLSSIDEPLNLTVPDNLLEQIESKISSQKTEVIPIRWVLAVAASILLLVSINLSVILNNNSSNKTTSENISTSLYDRSNQLY